MQMENNGLAREQYLPCNSAPVFQTTNGVLGSSSLLKALGWWWGGRLGFWFLASWFLASVQSVLCWVNYL